MKDKLSDNQYSVDHLERLEEGNSADIVLNSANLQWSDNSSKRSLGLECQKNAWHETWIKKHQGHWKGIQYFCKQVFLKLV